MTANLLRCSTCRAFRNLTEFQLTCGDERRGRQARRKKTCNACLDRRRGLYDPITYTSIDYPMSTWTNFLSRLENQIAGTELQLKASLPMRDAADSMNNLIHEISGIDGTDRPCLGIFLQTGTGGIFSANGVWPADLD